MCRVVNPGFRPELAEKLIIRFTEYYRFRPRALAWSFFTTRAIRNAYLFSLRETPRQTMRTDQARVILINNTMCSGLVCSASGWWPAAPAAQQWQQRS